MKKLTQEEFVKKAKAVHGDEYDYSLAVYTGSRDKVEIVCPKGHHFHQTPANHRVGRGCPICSGLESRLTKEHFIEKSIGIHGDKYDYSFAVYKGSTVKVEIVCPKGHHFHQAPSNHYHLTHPQGCSICAGKGHGKDMGSIFLEKATSKYGDLFVYGDDYIDSKTLMTITCTLHDEVCKQRPSCHLQGKSPCSKCVSELRRAARPSLYNATKAIRGDFNFPSYVYLIKMESENESFLKIGISKDVDKRILAFRTEGYQVEVVDTLYFDSCNDAVLFEHSQHVYFEESSYEPEIRFKGYTECFTLSILEEARIRLGATEEQL